MLALLIQSGGELYAINVREIVVEVLPMVNCRPLAHAPAGIFGVINYHGKPLPIVDLAEFVAGRPSQLRMSTRIIVVNYSISPGETHPLGIIAERAIETLALDDKEFVQAGVSTPAAPFLGPVIPTERGLIQRLDLHKGLPTSVAGHLFAHLEEYAAARG